MKIWSRLLKANSSKNRQSLRKGRFCWWVTFQNAVYFCLNRKGPFNNSTGSHRLPLKGAPGSTWDLQRPHNITSKFCRRSIEKIPYIYRKSIEHLSKVYRTSIEHLSNIFRKDTEHLSKIYRTCIENLSSIYRTSRRQGCCKRIRKPLGLHYDSRSMSDVPLSLFGYIPDSMYILNVCKPQGRTRFWKSLDSMLNCYSYSFRMWHFALHCIVSDCCCSMSEKSCWMDSPYTPNYSP